jgi:hypothetical protein
MDKFQKKYMKQHKRVPYSKKYATREEAKAARAHMIGKSDERVDRTRRADEPGKRVSKSGKIYYENRINRADYNPEMMY